MPAPNNNAAGRQRTLAQTAGRFEHELVAASQTAQVLGATGAAGDYLDSVLIMPATVGCGVVTLLDGSVSIPLFAGGGTTALLSVLPVRVEVKLVSQTGAWKITTGANVSALGIGDFT